MTIPTDVPFRSRFVYGIGAGVVDWSTTLPTRAWDRRRPTVGGSRTAAGGVPAAYVVREDHVLAVTLRVFESEWSDLIGMIQWGQFAESFVWYPDASLSVIATSFSVWLENPMAGSDVVPVRSSEYPRVLEQTIELRSVSALPWTLEYYAEPV
jgi:hypothetical protein